MRAFLPLLLLVSACSSGTEPAAPVAEAPAAPAATPPAAEAPAAPAEAAPAAAPAPKVAAVQPTTGSVLEWYQDCPDATVLEYALSEKDGKWVTQSTAEYEIEAKVDVKNGYVELMDDGTGGGSVILQVVLWRKADKSGLLGVSRGYSDGASIEGSVAFYSVDGGSWAEVTDQVLVDYGPGVFYDQAWYGANEAKLQQLYDEYGLNDAVTWKLPQKGTSPAVLLAATGRMNMALHGMGVQVSAEDRAALQDALDHVVTGKVSLTWDKEKGTFSL